MDRCREKLLLDFETWYTESFNHEVVQETKTLVNSLSLLDLEKDEKNATIAEVQYSSCIITA